MADPLLRFGDGHTELTEDDREGLLPSYISTRGELNDAEQRNIVEALLLTPPTVEELLDDAYLRSLHRAMFDEVWAWAGRYRLRETNIGIDPRLISTEVRTLVENALAWIEHKSFDPDELCIRFHHRLVEIHAFPNGNGRHGRIAADYLVETLGRASFSWGATGHADPAAVRESYVSALVQADRGHFDDLIAFARS